MRRLLAVLGALAMVGGALVLRSVIDDDGDHPGPNDGNRQVLLCATELAAVCDELARVADIEVIEEPAGETTGTLSTIADSERDGIEYDGWLTFSRNAEVVVEARERTALAPVLVDIEGGLARSPLVLAVWRDRERALAASCGGDVTWRCLGDVAGTSWQAIGGEAGWGDVKPGHADPETSAEGLAVIGQAAAQFFGRTNLSRDNFQNDAFFEWFARLERAVPAGGGVGDDSSLVRMLTAGPAAFDVVATTEAEAGPRLASASRDRSTRMTLLYPSPVATVDVVFAPVIGHGIGLLDLLTGDDGRAALARAGFRVDGEARADGVPAKPALPDKENLPDAGALEALLQTWREVTG